MTKYIVIIHREQHIWKQYLSHTCIHNGVLQICIKNYSVRLEVYSLGMSVQMLYEYEIPADYFQRICHLAWVFYICDNYGFHTDCFKINISTVNKSNHKNI